MLGVYMYEMTSLRAYLMMTQSFNCRTILAHLRRLHNSCTALFLTTVPVLALVRDLCISVYVLKIIIRLEHEIWKG